MAGPVGAGGHTVSRTTADLPLVGIRRTTTGILMGQGHPGILEGMAAMAGARTSTSGSRRLRRPGLSPARRRSFRRPRPAGRGGVSVGRDGEAVVALPALRTTGQKQIFN